VKLVGPACFILTTRFPLQTYRRVSNSSSSGVLNPDATPPSNGIIQGLKYDKNLSDSCPCNSLCCTARPPRTASSSTVFIAAVPDSSYKKLPSLEPIFLGQFLSLYEHKHLKSSLSDD
jgi:hypothetical protein